MPILGPILPQATGTIASLQQDVIDALQGRTDINSMIPLYVARAINELSEVYEFSGLEATGPQVTLTSGQSIYPISTFMNAGDDYSKLPVFAIFVDYPTNTVVTTLDYKTPKAIEPMIAAATVGLPSRWTRFGSNVHVGPTPNATYTVYWRYQVRHPFSTPPAYADPIYLPVVWYDIIAYSAAMRIAIAKRWTDQASFFAQLLFQGDEEYIKTKGRRGRPGLVAERILQQERDERYNTRQVMPRVSRYTRR